MRLLDTILCLPSSIDLDTFFIIAPIIVDRPDMHNLLIRMEDFHFTGISRNSCLFKYTTNLIRARQYTDRFSTGFLFLLPFLEPAKPFETEASSRPRSRKSIAHPESRGRRRSSCSKDREKTLETGRRPVKDGGTSDREEERERKERRRAERGSRETMTRIPRAVAGSIGECK